MEEVEELLEFLKSSRPDIRKQASKNVLDLTGTDSGIVLLNCAEQHDPVGLLARLLGDQAEIALNAAKALVNMSSNERARLSLLEKKSFWSSVLEYIAQLGPSLQKKDKPVPEIFLVSIKLLNNVTTSVFGAEKLMEGRLGNDFRGTDVRLLLGLLFTRPEELSDIGLVITNIAQLDDGRDLILDEKEPYLINILRLIDAPKDQLRKCSLETLRNCMINNPKLQLDLLARYGLCERMLKLLLGEEGIEDPEDFEELPKYLKRTIEESKKRSEEDGIEVVREPNGEIRTLIVDILLMVAQIRECREILRLKKTYCVIKVYHPTEQDEDLSNRIFDLVDLLLGEEDSHIPAKLPDIHDVYPDSLIAPVAIPSEQTEEKSILYDID